jgi:hypothetical protein
MHSAECRSITRTPFSRLADHHRPDVELPDQAAAVPAGRQRGHHDLVAVAALPAGAAEGVGLAVYGRVVLLHPAVVPPPQHAALGVGQAGADGDAALGQALPCLGQGHLEELFVVHPGPP